MCFICDRIEQIKNGENPYFVCELETGYVVLGDHQYFEGYTLFLCKQCVSELFDLEPEFRRLHLYEMTIVAQAVKNTFPCDKINYECLGNGDSHVHWHIFPRRENDLKEFGLNGKGPVWWLPLKTMWDEAYQPDQTRLAEMRERLKKCMILSDT